MTVSEEQGFDLFRKWSSESSPMLVYVGIDGHVAIRLTGVISALSHDGFVVSKYEDPERTKMSAEMAIGLNGAKEFDYREIKEARLETQAVWAGFIAGILSFKLPVGSCIVHELQTPPKETF